MFDWFYGALGVGLGALLTAIAGRWVNKDKEILEQGKQLRDELRQEIARLKETTRELEARIERLEKEAEQRESVLDEWRTRYYDLLQNHRLLELSYARLRHYTLELCRKFSIDPPDALVPVDEKKDGEE